MILIFIIDIDILIFIIQKAAIRILSNAHYRDSCRELNLFETQNSLPLPALYIFQIVLFCKKNSQYLENTVQNHSYNTRNKNLYTPLRHKTTAYEKGPLYSGQKFYNMLPLNIREEPSLNVFKILLKKFLFAKKIYCINDLWCFIRYII